MIIVKIAGSVFKVYINRAFDEVFTFESVLNDPSLIHKYVNAHIDIHIDETTSIREQYLIAGMFIGLSKSYTIKGK